jgi:hypothetical protein
VDIEAITVATYVEQLGTKTSKPTVKQHLAAIRQLFDYLTTGGVLDVNPAASVRVPRYARPIPAVLIQAPIGTSPNMQPSPRCICSPVNPVGRIGAMLRQFMAPRSRGPALVSVNARNVESIPSAPTTRSYSPVEPSENPLTRDRRLVAGM